jgi:hypothetical protein
MKRQSAIVLDLFVAAEIMLAGLAVPASDR